MHRWSLSNPEMADSLLAGHRARYDAITQVGRLSIIVSTQVAVTAVRALVIWWRAQRRAIERHAERRRAVATLRALDDRTLRDMGIARSEIMGIVEARPHGGPASLAELRALPRPGCSTAPTASGPQAEDLPSQSEDVAHSAGHENRPLPAPAVAPVVAASSPLRRYTGRPRYGLL